MVVESNAKATWIGFWRTVIKNFLAVLHTHGNCLLRVPSTATSSPDKIQVSSIKSVVNWSANKIVSKKFRASILWAYERRKMDPKRFYGNIH